MGVAELVLAGRAWTDEFDAAADAADAADVAAFLALVDHPDAEVRLVVAQTLPRLGRGERPTATMVDAAVRLSGDENTDVRDWACFALGTQWREVDAPALRDALAARLDDPDDETRCEALVGLAYRGDARTLPHVRAALTRPDGQVWILELVAAGALGDAGLHALVLQHEGMWTRPQDLRTVEAVRRLTDPDGPGDDVVDGVADLYRRRAHGLPEDDAVTWWHRMDAMLDIAPGRAPQFLAGVLDRLTGDEPALRQVRERSALAQLAAGAEADTEAERV